MDGEVWLGPNAVLGIWIDFHVLVLYIFIHKNKKYSVNKCKYLFCFISLGFHQVKSHRIYQDRIELSLYVFLINIAYHKHIIHLIFIRKFDQTLICLAFAREGYSWGKFNLKDLAEVLVYPGFYRYFKIDDNC